ncbi:unnamed protein product [Cylindrotheca closterium]|uniref:Glycosyl transferase 64 domain-containing protein n=1 Tax=Cylindrotheca closterium TaxID=2856 RepID=A0AAD2CBQ9_9STRA|nr:unnamed protein product [Cylindrotheca closterium]
MRRHHASPSKEMIRRRLFESPKKMRLLPSQVKGPILARGLIAFAVTFLVGVHVYLFRSLFVSSTTTGTTPNDNHRILENGGAMLRKSVTQEQWPPKDLQSLAPLEAKDLEQYTIRMNTWRRPEQLLVSVDHHASCNGVAQIQVIWCDKENEPPPELFNYSKVVVERHDQNSLNERFRILSPAPTLGILSIDDDALRPCEALDDGFFKWTRHPDRMIGFDARVHVENEDGSWKYGYMSTMEKSNSYSLSLTRYCFIHKGYMDMYMNALPASILNNIAEHFNCEDIAMSFMISSLTKGRPSLLADLWAIKSMVKLYVEEKISGGKSHKSLRDECVNTFAEIMGLKDGPNKLQPQPYLHKKDTLFECGDIPDKGTSHPKTKREKDLDELKASWHRVGGTAMTNEIRSLMSKTGFAAYQRGLIQKSDKWKDRFQSDVDTSASR